MTTKVSHIILDRMAAQKDRDGAALAMEAALCRGDMTTAAACRAAVSSAVERDLDLAYQLYAVLRKEMT